MVLTPDDTELLVHLTLRASRVTEGLHSLQVVSRSHCREKPGMISTKESFPVNAAENAPCSSAGDRRRSSEPLDLVFLRDSRRIVREPAGWLRYPRCQSCRKSCSGALCRVFAAKSAGGSYPRLVQRRFCYPRTIVRLVRASVFCELAVLSKQP